MTRDEARRLFLITLYQLHPDEVMLGRMREMDPELMKELEAND